MEAFHYINQSGTYGAGGEVDDKTGGSRSTAHTHARTHGTTSPHRATRALSVLPTRVAKPAPPWSGEQGVDEVIKAIHGIHSGDSPGPKAYVQDLYTIIAGILFLGNISFSGDEAAKVVDPAPLAQCAKLFGCSAEDLESALTYTSNLPADCGLFSLPLGSSVPH